MRASTFRWVGLALLGILIAAAVSVAASRLVSRQIGLDSEPITAGDALAPALSAPKGSGASRPTAPPSQTTTTPTTTVTVPATPTTTTTTVAPPAESTPGGGDGEHGGGGDHADD